MELAHFCSTSRVVIVAGKGGVGKTTVTATLATAAARAGMSVLIVEVEGKSGLPTAFGRPALGYEEQELAPKIRGRTLTPDAALRDWLEHNGLKRISKRLVQTGALDVIATAVPGMKDILVLGKVKSLEQERSADLIVVDGDPASDVRVLGDWARIWLVLRDGRPIAGTVLESDGPVELASEQPAVDAAVSSSPCLALLSGIEAR